MKARLHGIRPTRRGGMRSAGIAGAGARVAHERDALAAGAGAAAIGAFLAGVLSPGGDAAAHLYRTRLIEDGVAVWDALWYAGHYPLASYSALYYPLAALVGNVPLVLAATAGAAYLFASIAVRAWGDSGRWPAFAFALVAPVPLVLAQWPYAVGVAAGLASLRALQAGRAALAATAAAFTLAVSPLAFLVLSLAFVAAFAARPARTTRTLIVGLALAAAAALALATSLLFPVDLESEFPLSQLAGVLVVGGLGAAVAVHAFGRDPVSAFFAVWALAAVIAFTASLPGGENLTRVRWLVFPLVLAAALRVGFRPRWLVLPALAAALAYAAVPYARYVEGALGARSQDPAFWAPALEFLASRGSPQFRVEVVPTAAHWEAYYVPRAGHALARGWYRQLDLAENGLLYADRIDAAAYRAWLRARGVRYVVVPPARADQRGAEAERRLLLSGRSGLAEVVDEAGWRIYELPSATPILTGPGSPRLLLLDHEAIVGVTSSAGRHRLRVRHTPYWRVEGAVCASRASDGSTFVDARRPGRFRLAVRADLGAFVAALARRATVRCGRAR